MGKSNYGTTENVEIYELHDEHNTRIVSISPSEILNPYKVNIEYHKYLGLWYTVYIAIGKFKRPDENGIMEIEKGIAKLYYNSDLSLYDGELFYNSMNDL